MKPIHKFNGGRGATLCNSCSVIISTGLTEDLYCEKCKQKKLLIEVMEADEKDGLYKTNNMTHQTYGEWMRSNPPIPTLTAVDWYYEQTVIQGKTNYSELLEQAKQMEKEQIFHAFGVGCHVESTRLIGYHGMAEQYYNETYNK